VFSKKLPTFNLFGWGGVPLQREFEQHWDLLIPVVAGLTGNPSSQSLRDVDRQFGI